MLGVPAVSGQKTTKTTSFLQPTRFISSSLFRDVRPFQLSLSKAGAGTKNHAVFPDRPRMVPGIGDLHSDQSIDPLVFHSGGPLWNLDSIRFQVVFDGPQSWYDAGDIYI